MARKPIPIKIKSADLNRIEQLLHAGFQQVRVVFRALALRQLANGAPAPRVSESLPITAKAVRQIAHRYKKGGLERALYDRQRPGAKALLDDSQKQRIVAMVCGKPPEGRARWTVRLVAEEAV
jgi:transposase